MLQRFRESLTLLLIGLLPFHALFVTVATKLLLGPGHAPMPTLALWKEGILACVVLIALLEICKNIRAHAKWDAIDVVIGLLVILGFLIPSTNLLFGFKYDFVPLVAFVVLRRVPWSRSFMQWVTHLLLFVALLIAAYGIVTFFAPPAFFSALGYSDAHSLYRPDGPLSAFQQIGGSAIRRVQSTFSGPNQLAMWLLIPLGLLFSRVIRKREKNAMRTTQLHGITFAILVVLLLTFTRSAWIAAFVLAILSALPLFPRRIIVPMLSALAVFGVLILMIASLLLPSVIVRRASLIAHIERPLRAISLMTHHPLGMGLGAAGPAANRNHDACVFLESGADASWAKGTPSLCVFTGSVQVQPKNHTCDCAFLPENWYLQLGVELGFGGLLLWCALTILILKKRQYLPQGIFLAFLGLSIAALFLHAWEDAAVAYTMWMLMAACSPPNARRAR